MSGEKKHFSFLFAIFLTVIATACSNERPYQSPWGSPSYDPYSYDASQAERDSNFPVFSKYAQQGYSPVEFPEQQLTPTIVEQQDIPAPNGIKVQPPHSQASVSMYSVDTNTPQQEEQQHDFTYSNNTDTTLQQQQYNASSAIQPVPMGTSDNAVINQSALIKVGVLLPLSGQTAEIGNALLNAMQLALFDIADSKIAMIVKDTKGTPEGARLAAQQAIDDGAQIFLGPLFSSAAKEVAPIAAQHNINVLTFSTDWTTAGNNVFVMGFLPFTQVKRVIEYATQHGFDEFAALSPKTGYGAAVLNTMQRTLRENGVSEGKIERFSPIDNNISPLVREFTNYDERTKNMEEYKQSLLLQETPEAQDELANIEHIKTKGDVDFDAVLLPVGGDFARQMAGLFPYFEVDTKTVKLLGTGLWDDPTIMNEMALQGAWFAAPDPSLRETFERNYYATYDQEPPRIATLGYDAMALVAVLSYKGMKIQGAPFFGRQYLTSPNGYAGIDGIFRFRPDGLIERGLAVLEVRRGGAMVIDPAPRSFTP